MSDFVSDYPELLGNYMRNAPWAARGQYTTRLSPDAEMEFRHWVAQNNVPFDPDRQITDYDMRGFWQALQNKDPIARSAIDPNDQRLHYPDYWKTPYHATFSNESQWANHRAPHWDGNKLITQDGTVLFEDKPMRREQ